MQTSSKSILLSQQQAWAVTSGLSVDARGYARSYGANLWRTLSPRTLKAFETADGSELRDGPRRPAKMRALHSSSALAANVFDYWSDRDATPLLCAFGLEGPAGPIAFEQRFPTGLEGKSPNLDLAITLSSGTTVAIESKFSEWLIPKSPKKSAFKPKYFPPGKELWTDVGLPACQALANDIDARRDHYRFLDVPQLLKHSLGLATQVSRRFALYYMYFDWTCREQVCHNDELSRFAKQVGLELQFRVVTYQDIFNKLQRLNTSIEPSYLRYLRSRYFSSTA